jgi:hypothetical protein
MAAKGAMFKATFRCMKHLWVHTNVKSGIICKKKAKLSRPGSYEESVDYFWLETLSTGTSDYFTEK